MDGMEETIIDKPTDTIHYTEKEWQDEGERRFGKDQFQWKFVCPACGNTQSTEDFRVYKIIGATPNDAYQQCLGRFSDGLPNCDWASFGFFRGPSFVKGGGDDPEKQIPVFNFAEAV